MGIPSPIFLHPKTTIFSDFGCKKWVLGPFLLFKLLGFSLHPTGQSGQQKWFWIKYKNGLPSQACWKVCGRAWSNMRAHTNILVANVTRKAHQVLPQWRTYLSSTNRSRPLRSWAGALWIEVFGVWGPLCWWWWWSELEFRDGGVQSLRTLLCAQTSWMTLISDSVMLFH